MSLIIYIILGIMIFLLFVIILMYVKITNLQSSEKNQNDFFYKIMESFKQDINNVNMNNRTIVEEKFNFLNKNISNVSDTNFRTIQNQFKQSAQLIQEVTERLTSIDNTNKQVLNFSRQMQSLENILKNPKQRGILGEYFLETLLSNVLQPNQYKMQYRYNDGIIVDAAIFYKKTIIPIDAKFSLEKYNLIMQTENKIERDNLEKEFKRDIKLRIDETSKYIRPEEGTTEFAFMFIPAEGVYYNLLIYNVGSVQVQTKDLIEYAFKKKVIIVSPTSFYAYLETVLQGLKSQQVEENVEQIIKKISDLGNHLNNYENFMTKLGGNLSTTVNSYNIAARELKKVDKDIFKLTGGVSGGNYEFDHLDTPKKIED